MGFINLHRLIHHISMHNNQVGGSSFELIFGASMKVKLDIQLFQKL
jgi:hypothetical protein